MLNFFYEMGGKVEGVIAFYDTVVLDEVQTIRFTECGEIIGTLKRYLESGEYRVMGHRGTAESGFVILANIQIDGDGLPVHRFILSELPEFMQETALLLLIDFMVFYPGGDYLGSKRNLCYPQATLYGLIIFLKFSIYLEPKLNIATS